MATVLGITGPISWNSSASLVKDGKLIAVAEEERFIRVKHAPRIFPANAIQYCLNQAGITIKDVDSIAVAEESPGTAFWHQLKFVASNPMNAPFLFKMYTDLKVKQNAKFFRQKSKKIHFYNHHLSHAASAYHCSDFKEANILSIDGRGEVESTVLLKGKDLKMEKLKSYNFNNSLGALYENFTSHLGFLPHSHEGKVMGLASYGYPIFDTSDLITYTKDGYKLTRNMNPILDRVNMYNLLNFGKMLDAKGPGVAKGGGYLVKKFGPVRKKDDPITQHHRNIAACVQNMYEKALIKMATSMYDQTGISNFCLAGGVALNCTGNGILMDQPFVKDIFIQPASSDAGTSIGAALLEYNKNYGRAHFKMDHAYWGPEFTDEQIEAELKQSEFYYEKVSDIEGTTAELLAKDKLIGWFQGRMEIGPRALGHRSILASPKNLKNKDDVNLRVKHREPWRPFAPSILIEAMGKYFDTPRPSPYMILAFKVKQEMWDDVPAIVHVDGTARPQSVTKEACPIYHKMIKEFGKITGTPVVLNTSFNDKQEPIVCTPKDALRTFRVADLDYIAIGHFLVHKKKKSKK
jgi:carbamoyltransferase